MVKLSRALPLALGVACAEPRILSVDGPAPADGRSRAVITVDPGGVDPARLILRSTLGEVGPLSEVGDGVWRAWLTAGNVPGVADIWLERTDRAGQRLAAGNIELTGGEATSAQLHLHGPLSEGNATHAWHTDQAALWGVELLWWTDHDYLYLPDLHGTLYEPEWRDGDTLLTENSGNDGASFWAVEVDGPIEHTLELDSAATRGGQPSLRARLSRGGEGDPAWLAATWSAVPSRVRYPLLSEVGLAFSVWIPEDWDPALASIRVGLPMSTLTPDLQRELIFVDRGDAMPIDSPSAVIVLVDWTPGAWTDIEVDLSALALELLPEGLDQTVWGLTLYAGLAGAGEAEARLGGIRFWDTLTGESLIEAQRALLDESLSDTVRHLVGRELSYNEGGTLHLTAFGRAVPFLDYGLLGALDRFSGSRIVDAVHAAGGITAMTHPFGVTVQLDGDAAEGLEEAARTCDALDRWSMCGADMLEVGYTQRGYDLAAHLALWDCLSARGYVVTGVGTSDAHFTTEWERLSNRSVTWILAHGDEEADLIDALAAGRAFFGDPVLLDPARAMLDIRIGDAAAMGQVCDRLPAAPLRIEAVVGGYDTYDQLVWVVDGQEIDRDLASESPALSVTPGPWTVARAELRTPSGELKLASNPLYLSTGAIDAPASRIPAP